MLVWWDHPSIAMAELLLHHHTYIGHIGSRSEQVWRLILDDLNDLACTTT